MTNERVLATAMCEAYARNCGNDFKDHFDTRAAIIWMQQALEEVGVAELIQAAHDCNEWLCRTDREHTAYQRNLATALARVGAP